VLKSALAACFALAVASGAAEIFLRVASHRISPNLLIYFEPAVRAEIARGRLPLEEDTVLVTRDDRGPPLRVPKPSVEVISIDRPGDPSVRADEIGFCNPRGFYEGHPRIEILTVGDSFTHCHSVGPDETWPAELARLTDRTTYNLGMGGIGLYEYLQLLKQFGLAKSPRVVIFNIYEGNDLRDAVHFWEYREQLEATGRPPGESESSALPAITNGFLGRNSYTANFVAAYVTRKMHRRGRDRSKSGIDFGYRILLEEGPVEFNPNNRDRGEVVSAQRLQAGHVELGIMDEGLEQFAALGNAHGFVPILTYTPSAHTAYAERVRFDDESLEGLLREFSKAQRDFFAARATELGIPFYDLTPALQETAAASAAADLLYDANNLHLTATGNVRVAQAIGAFLEGLSLLAPEPRTRPDRTDADHARGDP
jgi:hypothetical protein